MIEKYDLLCGGLRHKMLSRVSLFIAYEPLVVNKGCEQYGQLASCY